MITPSAWPSSATASSARSRRAVSSTHGELAAALGGSRAALPAAGVRAHAHLLGADARALALRLSRKAASTRLRPRRAAIGSRRELDRRAARAAARHPARASRAPRCRSSCGRSSPTGRFDKDDGLGEPTVRRLFAASGLAARACAARAGTKTRLRWQAERPGALWHGDVCHGPVLVDGKRGRPCASTPCSTTPRATWSRSRRTTPSARSTCSACFVGALRRHGKPDALYLDNGSTYRGEMLQPLCAPTRHHAAARPALRPAGARQDGALLAHAARGLLDYLGGAHLAARHQRAPARLPRQALPPGAARRADGQERRRRLRCPKRARSTRSTRQRSRRRSPSRHPTPRPTRHHRLVRRQHLRARPGLPRRRVGRSRSAARSRPSRPWVEHEGKRFGLRPRRPGASNAPRKRPPRTTLRPSQPVRSAFDPPKALLDRALGRRPHEGGPTMTSTVRSPTSA